MRNFQSRNVFKTINKPYSRNYLKVVLNNDRNKVKISKVIWPSHVHLAITVGSNKVGVR